MVESGVFEEIQAVFMEIVRVGGYIKTLDIVLSMHCEADYCSRVLINLLIDKLIEQQRLIMRLRRLAAYVRT